MTLPDVEGMMMVSSEKWALPTFLAYSACFIVEAIVLENVYG